MDACRVPYDEAVRKTFMIQTHGCQMNDHDSQRIAGQFELDGMVAVDDIDDADVVVLNTCCIRENADNKLYGTLGHLKAAKAARPDMEIVVAGCLAQKDRDLVVKRAPHVDVVMGTHNVGRVGDLLAQSRSGGPIVEILEETALAEDELFPTVLPTKRDVGWASWVTIQVGCDNSCAFCIVPSVRGPEMSRPFGDLVEEVERLASDGVTEVTLLGQNVDSYGRDLAMRMRTSDHDFDEAHVAGRRWVEEGRRARPVFAHLLEAVGDVAGIRRVRFTSPHPKDIDAATLDVMGQHPAVCEHLHLPLQSGSDDVLAAMHRGYRADRYLGVVAEARSRVPDLAVTTDIIVGFPGETERDFDRTLEVAAAAEYDSAYTFVYSPREGTEAAAMVDEFVPHAVAIERMERLRAVVERSSRRANEARIGRIEEVVVEGPSKRDPARLTGRTRQNRLVHFETPESIRVGSYATVEVTGAALSSVSGELVEVTRPATHRTRIPVLTS